MAEKYAHGQLWSNQLTRFLVLTQLFPRTKSCVNQGVGVHVFAAKFRNFLIVPSNKFGGSSICILLFCIANYSHVFIYSILKLNTNVEIYSLDSFEIENIVLHDILINTLRIRNLFDKTSQISQGYLVSKRFLIQKLSHQI